MILAVNTGFPEINHLAAGLAEAGLLSTYVRPYANLQRSWECLLARLSGLGPLYTRSFGRRRMPEPLSAANVREAAVLIDFLMSTHVRLPSTSFAYKAIRESLVHARTNAIAAKAEKVLTTERIVVASWGCAELVFRKAKARGSLCVLNYPLAHHRFARRYLFDEASRQPGFAGTLNSHDEPRWLEQRFDTEIELADRILIGSSFVRDSFIEEGVPPEKLVVVPYGADTSLFQPNRSSRAEEKNLRLLFVGQISQRKGLSYLLEAIRRLEGYGYTLTLVGRIQGEGRALTPYRHLFHHVDHVPRAQLSQIYQTADVFVFPTLIEGLPLVVLEAMASGLPIITTPNGPGDVVRDGVDGFLVPPRNVDAIVARVVELKENPDLRKRLGSNAHLRAQEFTWRRYRASTVRHFRAWLQSR